MKKVKLCLTIIGVFLCFTLFLGLFVPNSNNNNNLQQIDFSSKIYCAMGDSITYGVQPKANGMRMNNPYPTLVKNELGLKQVYNYGIGGSALCYDMCNRVNNMVENADIISVFGGTNDFYAGNYTLGTYNDKVNSTIYGALNIIADTLTTKYPNAFIFFMTPLKRSDVIINDAGYKLSDVADAIKVVGNMYDIPVLDLYNNCPFEIEYKQSFSDGLHPTQDFHTNYLAPQIAQFIKDNYKK